MRKKNYFKKSKQILGIDCRFQLQVAKFLIPETPLSSSEHSGNQIRCGSVNIVHSSM